MPDKIRMQLNAPRTAFKVQIRTKYRRPSFEVLFDVKSNLDAPQLELASAKSISDESGGGKGDNEIEAQLNKVYHKLATALPARDRESLKEEQLKWLATREHITAAEKDEKEFVQLRLTRRRVAELETRARYR